MSKNKDILLKIINESENTGRRQAIVILCSIVVVLLIVIVAWSALNSDPQSNKTTSVATQQITKSDLVAVNKASYKEPTLDELETEESATEDLKQVLQQAFETDGRSLDEDKYPWARCSKE